MKLFNFLMVGLGGALGSFAIGYLSGSLRQEELLLLLTVGLCGGFTTFSTYSLQSLKLIQQERFGALALYAVGTVALCLILAAAGWYVSQKNYLSS